MSEYLVGDDTGGEGRPEADVTAPVATPMVERAFRLLDHLAVAEEGQTLTELARAVGMSKGSLHGLLKTLESGRVVTVSSDRRFTLGPRVFELAQRYQQGPLLRRLAAPAMRRLAASIGETTLLGRVEHDSVVIIERAEPPAQSLGLRVSAERGARVHLLAGAFGRLILGSWPREQREAFLRAHTLPRFTDHSITDPERYLAAVAEAARLGIGEDREEYLIGVNAVAAPIRGADGALVALLWVVGFNTRFTGALFQRAGQEVREEAQAISRRLGVGVAGLWGGVD